MTADYDIVRLYLILITIFKQSVGQKAKKDRFSLRRTFFSIKAKEIP